MSPWAGEFRALQFSLGSRSEFVAGAGATAPVVCCEVSECLLLRRLRGWSGHQSAMPDAGDL